MYMNIHVYIHIYVAGVCNKPYVLPAMTVHPAFARLHTLPATESTTLPATDNVNGLQQILAISCNRLYTLPAMYSNVMYGRQPSMCAYSRYLTTFG